LATPKVSMTAMVMRLAGFIEAEASFGIRPNNGGRSWVCHHRRRYGRIFLVEGHIFRFVGLQNIDYRALLERLSYLPQPPPCT